MGIRKNRLTRRFFPYIERVCKPGSVFDSHLSKRAVAGALQPPRERTGRPIAPIPVLLRIEFTASTCLHATSELLPHFSTLTDCSAVYFCCTGLGVASTGRYPASCPVKPGLSSSAAFRSDSRDHLSYLNPSFVFRHILPA